MADLTYDKTFVRPLEGAITRTYIAGEAAECGNTVYMKSDGLVWLTDDDNAAEAEAIGVIVAVASNTGIGVSSAAAGQTVEVCTLGPIAGFSGLTPGAIGYTSGTFGKISDAAPAGPGLVKYLGWCESAEVFFFRPGVKAVTGA